MLKTKELSAVILAAALIVAVLGGATLFSYRKGHMAASPDTLAKPSPSGESASTHSPLAASKNVYVNDAFGFSFAFPESWSDYSIDQKSLANGTSELEVLLPLKTDAIAQWLSEPYKSRRVFKVWSLYVKDIKTWENEKTACDGAEAPCFAPIEIGRNTSYVIGAGQFYSAAGWDPCADSSARLKEPDFCSEYSKILTVDQKASLKMHNL